MASHSTAHRSGKATLTPFLLLGSMLAAAVLYVNAQYPGLMDSLQYQFFGMAPAASSENSKHNAESERLKKINALIISARNKMDLRENRPFWGAASHMVELAFKGPADDVTISSQGARIYEFHRYGFNGNREPVVMEFANNALTCVHYPQRKQTSCSPGARSFYNGKPFPFNYRVQVR